MKNVYEIPSDKVKDAKKILENPDVVVNKWSRNGYNLRDAKTLGFSKNACYLYVEADESFFKENEKQITSIEGVKKLEKKELEDVKKKMESEQEGAAEGIGAIFG